MKRLLLISYYWPPLGGPGSLRPVKFARYLPEFGYEPVVLTRKSIPYHSMDQELGDQVKDIKTLRTESMDPARLLHVMGMRDYRPKPWHLPAKQAMNFPDHKIMWLPFAYQAAHNRTFDYIFVTAPPFSAFLIGYYLARATLKPLVIDFRDAWLEFPFLPYKTVMKKAYVSHWEKKLVDIASLIIVVDKNIMEKLVKRYPYIKDRIFVIPNGYDPEDFTVQDKPGIFTISYLGTIREERNPVNILKAIGELIQTNKIPAHDIKIKFIGHIEDRYLREIKRFAFAATYGHLPYTSAIKEFSSAHLSIIITTGSQYFFPSRQNEYLATGLPVLVCGRSKGMHLLEKAVNKGYPGWIFEYHDIQGIKKQILDVYQKYKKGRVIKGITPYTQFTRRNLTKDLCGLIDKI
jgi:glycosyltransferase involved in cell wall biosynthesis